MSSAGQVLDLIAPVASRYRDSDTARFAIGDFIDALHDAGFAIVAAVPRETNSAHSPVPQPNQPDPAG